MRCINVSKLYILFLSLQGLIEMLYNSITCFTWERSGAENAEISFKCNFRKRLFHKIQAVRSATFAPPPRPQHENIFIPFVKSQTIADFV